MKAKLVIIALLWLVPLACWFGASSGDRTFAMWVGGAFSLVLTLFFATRPMLECGRCGASTPYFANYTERVARLNGNWRRYFICRSCGSTIDRVTGMPTEVPPQTPVVPPASSSDLAWGVSALGGLLIFVAVVLGSLASLSLASDMGDPVRARVVLGWCLASAAAGLAVFFLGRFVSSR